MTTGLSVRAEGLRRRFRTGFSVEVDSLSIPAGNTLAILGPSGSGKSTLLSMLGLLERPDTGTITVGERQVTATDRAARMEMAAVFQRPYLIKGSVQSNVEYGLALRRVPQAERAERAARALARVGLESFGNRSASTLSGGEAQRVALARALVLRPRVLLMDEPLASLDPLLKRRLVGDFASILHDEGVTVIYVTHDHDEAQVIADDVAIMNRGRIVAHGPVSRVMAVPADEWTAEFLGLEAPGRGTVVSSADGLMTIDCGESVIVSAAGELPAGTRVQFTVAPEDVMLAPAEEDLGHLSARNRLSACVQRIEPRGSTWRVVSDAGSVSFASNVSHAALREIGLEVGAPLQVVFKATAVRVATVS